MSRNKPYRLLQLDELRWEIPKTGKMRVPGLIYTDAKIFPDIEKDESPDQVYNVAHLPGIIRHSLAMPDVHWGYGFPIGGVAAFDLDEGVVSPGGVGYDINCGVRLALTDVTREIIAPRIRELVDALFNNVPSGLGSKGGIHLNRRELNSVLKNGAGWAVQQGMGEASDLDKIEDRGALENADPGTVSDRAFERGKDQLGTLGSGNHFLEIGYIEEIYDTDITGKWGIFPGQVTMMVHSGSRGLGYQVCDEFLVKMVKSMASERIELPDRQLACARLRTSAAREYMGAMAAASNFAFANRQILMSIAKETWERSLGMAPRELKLRLLYDVCHNIAKMETHMVNGSQQKVCVHRKGATRAYPAHHPSLPHEFKTTGQPVLIPGDMGRASFILVGRKGAMEKTFGSACHGAGRLLSRNEAVKKTKGRAIERELLDSNIYARSAGRKTLREEFPGAYKDVGNVVEVVQRAGLAAKVAKIKPLGVIKG